ncbi:hypothetical protein PV327_010727 [Microctonus hyperodae]|uniref:39S ribosomal protein L28, mitochondrial n=1 Tax=Microctonus hyperodae TaxID=165561 RepID=A0AA39C889_MICHY|nr:hypothetical protein PV327_010727 [Microctonus hyperodae]
MATSKYVNRLYYMPRPNRWQTGIGASLPEAYKKFWKEWKIQRPTAVHYVHEEGKYKFDEYRGLPVPIQNVPLPLRYPKEIDEGIWGGEAVVQGLCKKGKYRRPVAKFWVPRLLKSVIYSEVLDKYMKTIVTQRTLDLIHENYGFDHYLLKTPACDLRSLLALKIKKNILIALADKTLYPDDEKKRMEVYEKYKEYLNAYTREEIEWYGLSWSEAGKKYVKMCQNAEVIEPLKVKYRAELIAKLQAEKDKEKVESKQVTESSWLSRVNPFSKSPKP